MEKGKGKTKTYCRETVTPESLTFIDGYLDHLEEKEFSAGTITAYRIAYYAFFSHCHKPFNEIVYIDVRNWLEYYETSIPGKVMSPCTMDLRITSLKSLYLYWLKKKKYQRYPLKRVGEKR